MHRTNRKIFLVLGLLFLIWETASAGEAKHEYNGPYRGEYLNRVAFPLGGIGAGMVCLDGVGSISQVSVRHAAELKNEPMMFAAVCVKGTEGNTARVLEGPVPGWKVSGIDGAGCGSVGKTYGLPRFEHAEFMARFPFGIVKLDDAKVPVRVEITGWSPFVPGDEDNSSLPMAGLEYRFVNTSGQRQEAVFSYHSANFMRKGKGDYIEAMEDGFVLGQMPKDDAEDEGAFAIMTPGEKTIVDQKWIRYRSMFDTLTIAWESVEQGRTVSNMGQTRSSEGASLYVPFTLEPGGEKVVHVLMCWYVPTSKIQNYWANSFTPGEVWPYGGKGSAVNGRGNYEPWYAGRFEDIDAVIKYCRDNYESLRARSAMFRDAFYTTTLPAEVIEAVSANLSILKSPTVFRQKDGRLWCWEGVCDLRGCCEGSCTHVWNYNQAISHLFPKLEQSLRHTEYNEMLEAGGQMAFRANLPIRPGGYTAHVAIDGQLGGIMKMYREWRISGDTEWIRKYWGKIKLSLDFVIGHFDPRGTGLPEEGHHNTYDIEFFGPNGYSGTYYVGALAAAVRMGEALGEDVSQYRERLAKAKGKLEGELFDGEYFVQKIMKEGLTENFKPLTVGESGEDTRRIIEQINEQGPVYQYGAGCLSDGVIGLWMAKMCGIDEALIDDAKVKSHLQSVYKYNLKHDLFEHANPQRPSYAMGHEGGLLLCTWPKGGKLTLPFIYSNEVWTGIEYQAAGHMILEGLVKEGLDVVRTARDRYDGRVRNPFDEYECGHWYGRALSSYGLLQSLTGVRYDAVEKTLYIDSKVGDEFTTFFAGAEGFGTVGLKGGKPFVKMAEGKLQIDKVVVSGESMMLDKTTEQK